MQAYGFRLYHKLTLEGESDMLHSLSKDSNHELVFKINTKVAAVAHHSANTWRLANGGKSFSLPVVDSTTYFVFIFQNVKSEKGPHQCVN